MTNDYTSLWTCLLFHIVYNKDIEKLWRAMSIFWEIALFPDSKLCVEFALLHTCNTHIYSTLTHSHTYMYQVIGFTAIFVLVTLVYWSHLNNTKKNEMISTQDQIRFFFSFFSARMVLMQICHSSHPIPNKILLRYFIYFLPFKFFFFLSVLV